MSNSASGSRTVQRPVAAQLDQRQRVHLEQADVLGQLVLALVQVVVGHLHALDVQVELLAGQQAFLAGQVAELEIAQLGSPSSCCRARSAFLAMSKANWKHWQYSPFTSRFIQA